MTPVEHANAGAVAPTAASPESRTTADHRSLHRMIETLLAATTTTSFRLMCLLVSMVVATGAVVLWLLFSETNDVLSRRLVETMTVEAEGLADIKRLAGTPAFLQAIEKRAQDPLRSGRLYFVAGADGHKLAGNLDRWPPDLATKTSGGVFHYTAASGSDRARLAAGVELSLSDSELKLLVARDLDDQRTFADHVRWLFIAGFGALALTCVTAGLMTSRMVLNRIADIVRTSDAIMSGDLSGRIPVSGSGDELDRLSGNLNAMLDRIEKLVASLREVSDNIAHDLKTPLTRLRSRAEAAMRDAGSPGDLKDALGHVIEEADELIKTFNALLLIARLEAGALERTAELFDVGDVARDVAELYAPVCEEAGLHLTCDAPQGIRVRANRQLVSQALANLVDNAIKYGRPANGSAAAIDVSVSLAGNTVLLAVSDHGRGIPEADRERVLKRFVRLDASRSQPGTGLGLSLVAAVARMHGGRLRLEDNAPGLRMVLELPCPS